MSAGGRRHSSAQRGAAPSTESINWKLRTRLSRSITSSRSHTRLLDIRSTTRTWGFISRASNAASRLVVSSPVSIITATARPMPASRSVVAWVMLPWTTGMIGSRVIRSVSTASTPLPFSTTTTSRRLFIW